MTGLIELRRRLRQTITAVALAPFERLPAPPPIGAAPARYGNGRVEIQVYPGATMQDRLAAAHTLLEGSAWTVALRIEEPRDG